MASTSEYAVKVRVRSDDTATGEEVQVCYRWATSPEDAADQMRGFDGVLEVLQVGTRGEVTL